MSKKSNQTKAKLSESIYVDWDHDKNPIQLQFNDNTTYSCFFISEEKAEYIIKVLTEVLATYREKKAEKTQQNKRIGKSNQ